MVNSTKRWASITGVVPTGACREGFPHSACTKRRSFDFHIGKTHQGGPTTNVESLLPFSVIPQFLARQLCAQEKIKGLPHSRPNLIPAALPWALRGSM